MTTLKEKMMQKKAQIAEQTGKGVRTVKPKVGKTRVRILPSWRGKNDEPFWHDFGQHYIKDSNDKVVAVYVCVEKTYGKSCSICEMIREGIDVAKTDEQKGLLASARANGRVLVNALMLETDPSTPVILELTPTTYDKVIDIILQGTDEDPNFNNVTDVDNGIDLIITRSGTGINTEYSVQPALKGSKEVPKSILEDLINLDQFVAQEQEAAMLKSASAIKSIIGKERATSKSSAFDEDDIPFYPSPKGLKDVVESDDVVETEEVDSDELESLLNELDD